jgi:hypothetical protein
MYVQSCSVSGYIVYAWICKRSWKVKMAHANCITNMQEAQFPISIYISLFLNVQGLQENTVFIKGISLT